MSRPVPRALAWLVPLALVLGSCKEGDPSVSARIDPLATEVTTVEGPEGIVLDVPPGAVTSELVVVLTVPQGRRTVAGATVVGPALVAGPEGTEFSKTVSVSIPITPTALPAGKTIDDVVVLTAPDASTAFVPLPTRRGTGAVVVAETAHFSQFIAVVPDRPAPNGMRHIFQTTAEFDGNLGGIAGADSLCMGDANRPNSGRYKAMILGTARRACTDVICMVGPDPVDWVFLPQTTYYVGAQGSEVAFATTDTNAIITTYPLGANTAGRGKNFWNGFSASGDWLVSPTETCADWSSNAATGVGSLGWDSVTDVSWLHGGNYPCSDVAQLVCVEQ